MSKSSEKIEVTWRGEYVSLTFSQLLDIESRLLPLRDSNIADCAPELFSLVGNVGGEHGYRFMQAIVVPSREIKFVFERS